MKCSALLATPTRPCPQLVTAHLEQHNLAKRHRQGQPEQKRGDFNGAERTQNTLNAFWNIEYEWAFPSKSFSHVNCHEVGYTPDDNETVFKSLKPLCFALLAALAWQLKMHSGMQCTIFPVALKGELWKVEKGDGRAETANLLNAH